MPDTNNENLTVTASDEPGRGVYVDKLVDKHDIKYRIYDYRLEDGLIDGSIVSGRDIESSATEEEGAISAGTKAFTWSSATGTTYTKDSHWVFNIIGSLGEGQAVDQGEYVSVKANASESYIGILDEAIGSTSTQVKITLTRNAVQKWTPMASNVCGSEEKGYLWFPGHPEIGAIDKGIESITFGYGTRANEECSFAVGRFNEADGRYSFASGRQNKVGYAGIVTGRMNKNFGMHSAMFGYLNESNASNSLIFGRNNINNSSHTGSIVGGAYNTAQGANLVVLGNYAYTDGDKVLILGNGTAEDARINLATIDTVGNLHLKGSVYIGSDGQNNGGSNFSSAFYGVCSTPAGTAAKVVNNVAGVTELTAGLTIRVKFENSNQTNAPTLNVNSLGAFPINQFGSTAAGKDTGNSWAANQVVSLTYDGTAWQMNDYQTGFKVLQSSIANPQNINYSVIHYK